MKTRQNRTDQKGKGSPAGVSLKKTARKPEEGRDPWRYLQLSLNLIPTQEVAANACT